MQNKVTSQILLITIFTLLNLHIQKKDHSLITLVTQTHYVLELQELLSIILLQGILTQILFFSREEFKCLRGNYPIETRWHIYYDLDSVCQNHRKWTQFLFYFIFLFYFLLIYFSLFFYFYNSGVRVKSDWSCCHISHI